MRYLLALLIPVLLLGCNEKPPPPFVPTGELVVPVVPPGTQAVIYGDSFVTSIGVIPGIFNASTAGRPSGTIATVVASAPTVYLEGGTVDLLMQLPWQGILANYRVMLDKLQGQVILVGLPQVDTAQMNSTLKAQGFGPQPWSNDLILSINAELAKLCATYPNCRTSPVMQYPMVGRTVDGIHLRPDAVAGWLGQL